MLARVDLAKPERIARPGEGFNRALGNRLQPFILISKNLRQRPSGVEVKTLVRVIRDLGVFPLHRLAQFFRIHVSYNAYLGHQLHPPSDYRIADSQTASTRVFPLFNPDFSDEFGISPPSKLIGVDKSITRSFMPPVRGEHPVGEAKMRRLGFVPAW